MTEQVDTELKKLRELALKAEAVLNGHLNITLHKQNVKKGIKGALLVPPDLRFLNSIKKGPKGCWNWTGALTADRPCFSVNGKNIRVTRWLMKDVAGLKIENLFVCHKCDNILCVNPDHLFLGTHKENMRDMLNKKRSWMHKDPDGVKEHLRRIRKKIIPHSGETHPMHKLSEKQVIKLLKLHASGKSRAYLTKFFNITKTNVGYIINGDTWNTENVRIARQALERMNKL